MAVFNKEIPLTGRLRTADDPAVLITDFQSMKNLRYGDANPKGISGMSKINTTALTTYLKIRSGMQFIKERYAENHVLVQAYNTGLTASQVLENTTAIPSQGDFSGTALWTDSSGAGRGRFSYAPDGAVAYCNGVDTCIYGGTESEIGRFINYHSSGTWEYDYTDILRNTLTDSLNIATVQRVSTDAYFYLGSTRPIKGFKAYIGTANTSTGTMAVNYWSGSAWTAVTTLSDGTIVSGKTLAQTGSVTFDSTISITKVRAINGIALYWYQIIITGISAGVTLTHLSVNMPFQTIKDIWDGAFRACLSLQVYKNSTYNDYTVNVIDDNYDSQNTATFIELDSLATATDYFVGGFSERLLGISFHLIGGHVNTTASTTMTVSYSSDGVGWTTVGTITDGTASGGVSFAKSGVVTWNPPSSILEFEKTISNEIPLLYYKVSFSQNLSADVQMFYVGGIPAQKELRGYKFPLYARDRLWLCDNTDRKKNSAICSASNSADVWNGDDTEEFYFGDDGELTQGCSLYSRFGSSIYNITLFFKKNAIWGITGNNVEDFVQFEVSNTIGCIAPLTLSTTIISTEQAQKPIAIWQGANGIYLFDNNSPIAIHHDIRNYFDKTKSECITASKVGDSVGFIDEERAEYHWLFASGSGATTLNKELVFDLKRLKWFEVDRGAKDLQFGMVARDTYGNFYNYGAIDTGYLERLENGTSMDGTSIAYELQLGDVAPYKGSIMELTQLIRAKLIMVAKGTTTQTVAITHYGDGATSGTVLTDVFDPTNSGYRIADCMDVTNLGNYIFHSFKMTISTDDETYGFEPLFLGCEFNLLRKDLS